MNTVDAAFRDWLVAEEDSYATIAARALADTALADTLNVHDRQN